MEESTASFLDKTDWRKTIHRKLEGCIDASGRYWYPFRLSSLIDAVSAEYPGFDARADITEVMICCLISIIWFGIDG